MKINDFGNFNNTTNTQLLKRSAAKDDKNSYAGILQQTHQNFNLKIGGEVSRGLPDGSNVTVYKAAGYTPENPLLRIVTTQANGQQSEQTINPKKINIRNATEDEILALNAYLVDTGSLDNSSFGTVILGTKSEQANFDHAKTRLDFISLVSELTETQYNAHNMAAYTRLNKVLNTYKSLIRKS